MLPKQHAHAIGAGIASPGSQEYEPHQIHSVVKPFPQQIEKGKHYRPVKKGKHGRHDLVRMIFRKRKHINKQKNKKSRHNHKKHDGKSSHKPISRSQSQRTVIHKSHNAARKLRRTGDFPFLSYLTGFGKLPVGNNRNQKQHRRKKGAALHKNRHSDHHQQYAAQ